QHAVTDAVPFAAIPAVGNDAQGWDVLAKRLSDGGGAVAGAVVDDDDLDRRVRTANIGGDTRQCGGQPKLFVVGGNDDRQVGDGAGHRNCDSFQPYAPTRGTNRQDSSMVF